LGRYLTLNILYSILIRKIYKFLEEEEEEEISINFIYYQRKYNENDFYILE
jgi:hypothetical protein